MAEENFTLESLDPQVFGSQPGAQPSAGTQNLQTVDPTVFANQPPAIPAGVQSAMDQAVSDPNLRMGAGAAAGAALGGARGAAELFRPMQTGEAELGKAQTMLAGREAKAGALEGQFAQQMSQFDDYIKGLTLQAANAQAELSQITRNLAAAQQQQQKFGSALTPAIQAIDAAINTAPGTSELAGSLTQGALRHSAKMGEVREANQVRKGIAGYQAGLPASERVPLTGYTQSSRLIVPNELANAPVMNPEQAALEAEIARLTQAREAAAGRVAEAQKAQGKARAPIAPQALSTAQANAAEAAARVKALEPSLMGKVGLAAKKFIPGLNILGGALSGAELVRAYDLYRQGKITDATFAALTGAGGLAMMVPSPPVIGAGVAMSVADPLRQGYKYLAEKEPQAMYPNITAP